MSVSRDNGAGPIRNRHVVAVEGGRDGVGKTLMSVNLSVYLAQLGRNVILFDADPNGSNAHTMLGLDHPPLAHRRAIRDQTAPSVATSVPGLRLVPAAYDPWRMTPRRTTRASHWMAQLDDHDADYVVIHLGTSTVPAALDAFVEAGLSICVTAPEPPAIDATYRFCRALFARRLRRTLMRERHRLRIVDKALAQLPPLPTPRALVSEIARFDQHVANLAAHQLQRLRPRLVVGKTRLRQDLDLGPAMVSLAERYLGISLDYLGYVEQDDAAWLTARRRRPLLIDAPTSKASRNIERVARRILALLAQPRRHHDDEPLVDAKGLNAPLTLYQVLGVDRSASDDEIRRAYKLQRSIFRDDSLPVVSIVDEETMRREQALMTEAYDTLLDPSRRRAYDLSVFPDDEPHAPQPQRGPTATEAELAVLQAELAREITGDTQFTGPLLKRAREARGLDIHDVANTTKISPMHLRALEEEKMSTLPALVYVRGFLQQVAKALHLDPAQVTKSYLKRYRAARPSEADP
ncbi:MAG: helix-turn-helix domain-containing protein [Myxococcota bacterium]